MTFWFWCDSGDGVAVPPVERHRRPRGAAAAGLLPRQLQRQARQEGAAVRRAHREVVLLRHDDAQHHATWVRTPCDKTLVLAKAHWRKLLQTKISLFYGFFSIYLISELAQFCCPAYRLLKKISFHFIFRVPYLKINNWNPDRITLFSVCLSICHDDMFLNI